MLAAQTRRDGLVHGETKLTFAGQNPASIEAFGSTLVTWRFQTHTKSKVMYSFADRREAYAAPTKEDWVEFRNTTSGEHWPLFGEDMRLFRSASGKLLANWCEVAGEINGKRAVHFYFGEISPPASAQSAHYSSFQESLYVKWPPAHVSTRHERSPTSEKNWPMFEYEGQVVFLERIQPMRAVVPGKSAPLRTHQGIAGTVFGQLAKAGIIAPVGGIIDGEFVQRIVRNAHGNRIGVWRLAHGGLARALIRAHDSKPPPGEPVQLDLISNLQSPISNQPS